VTRRQLPTCVQKARLRRVAGIRYRYPCPIFVIIGPAPIQLAENIEVSDAHRTRSTAELGITVGSIFCACTDVSVLTWLQNFVSVKQFKCHHSSNSTRAVNRRSWSARYVDAFQHFGLEIEPTFRTMPAAGEILASSFDQDIHAAIILQATDVDRLQRVRGSRLWRRDARNCVHDLRHTIQLKLLIQLLPFDCAGAGQGFDGAFADLRERQNDTVELDRLSGCARASDGKR